MSLCKVEDCPGGKRTLGGYCPKHYTRWKKWGDPLTLGTNRKHSTCTAPDCGQGGAIVLGYCTKHYQRFKLHGNPLEVRLPPTPVESFAVHTEWEGECLVWSGSRLASGGYGQINIAGKPTRAHRYAWERENGPIPKGYVIDHTCHNPACVYIGHLRLASPKQNAENIRTERLDNTSGHRGVWLDKRRNLWAAEVTHNRKRYSRGTHPLYELHVAAYHARELRNELFTHNDKDRT